MKKLSTLTLLVAITISAFAQNCDEIRNSPNHYSALATGATEQEARINALSLLAENISSVVSSRTDMMTKDDGTPGLQKFYNYSKSTSVLQLKGVRYITCDRNKKNGITALAFISRKDLEQSAAEVSARVQQYLSLMEQKEAKGMDFLPEAYIAYLNTFMSPYAIEYKSDTRQVSNVRSYLESYLRTYLSNITVTCPAVAENPEYPDQQLTIALSLTGANNTRMGFAVEIPEYNAKGMLDGANGNIDIIMTPDSRSTKFNARLSLVPPPLETDLKDISERVGFSRDVTFDANMSRIIKLDFTSRNEGNYLVLTPAVGHLAIHRLEWFSEGTLLSTDQQPRIPAGIKELTLRINGNDNLVVTKTFPSVLLTDASATYATAAKTVIMLEPIENSPTQMPLAQSTSLFPQDAIILVYSDRRDLSFHSSMSAIERQTYNSIAGRYELVVKPIKQIFSVEAEGLMEKGKEVINPQHGDILYFRATVVSLNKGLLVINSFPPNATVYINDIETIHRTPCTLEVNGGLTNISLRKRYFQQADTVVHIDAGDTRELSMSLLRAPGMNDTSDALSYLNGRHEREYYPAPEDPAKIEAAAALRSYQRRTIILKRRAAMYYTTAVMFVGFGAGYHWLDRTLFDTSTGTSHTSLMSGMGNAFYIMGGATLVGGIITSAKLAHHKKSWNIQPVPEPGGAGVLLTYKFK